MREQIWKLVSFIPAGKVATYGQLAALAGMPSQARLVGRILSQLPADTRLPWHRVVASQGRIASPDGTRQRQRLQAEGVALVRGRVRLGMHQWRP